MISNMCGCPGHSKHRGNVFFLHFCCYCTLKIKCWIVFLIEFPVLFIWIFCKSSYNKDLILIGMTRNDPFILLIFLTHAHVLINRQSWFLCVLLPKYSIEKARLLVFAPINNLFVFLCAEIGLIISLITVLNGINFVFRGVAPIRAVSQN